MDIRIQDFNGADAIFAGELAPLWKEIATVLSALPLYVQDSAQEGKAGETIFDPKAANRAIKNALTALGWKANTTIPTDVAFLGKEVDYFHSGLLVEVQFSNYPFLLNNVVRSELLQKSKALLGDTEVRAVAIIARAHMIPASNSVLYFERAVEQIESLAKHGVIDVPMRVVGLFTALDVEVPGVWTEYKQSRAREPTNSEKIGCTLSAGTQKGAICKVLITRLSR